MNVPLILEGLALVCVGMIIKIQDEQIEEQQALLHAVAVDNMALRFHIHNTEVNNNA